MKTSSLLRSPRRGRLLVECLVATLLLSATTMLVAGLAQTTAVATDRVRATTSAWALSTQAIEADISAGCGGPLAGTRALPRVQAVWTDVIVGPWRERTLDVASAASPLARIASTATSHLTAHAAWSCP
ncbi:MAG: hypothetical protein IT353_06290 [Gemmatimonadaceae bacterium]|nr:hypothetical protein [Gemmatimonadaceae bacterium]